jgi:hypothetical protein
VAGDSNRSSRRTVRARAAPSSISRGTTTRGSLQFRLLDVLAAGRGFAGLAMAVAPACTIRAVYR